MRILRFPAILSLVFVCYADQRTQRLLERLAEETAAFERIAPNLIAEETLKQNALAPGKKRFKPGPGAKPGTPDWKQREIRSEYIFTTVGNPGEIRELRKVTAIDGKAVNTSAHAVEQLLQTIQAKDEKSRKKLLVDFEKHGLIGTVTDFGQVILLFARKGQELYTYNFTGERLLGAEPCHVFTFHQQDGPGAMTIWDSTGKQQPRISGEIWVTRNAYRPLRVKLNSVRNEGATVVREEADVQYAVSSFGPMVPASVVHKQYRDGQVSAENHFQYGEFRKFGASALLKYSTDDK